MCQRGHLCLKVSSTVVIRASKPCPSTVSSLPKLTPCILREYALLGIWNPQVQQLRHLKRTNIQTARSYAPRLDTGKLTIIRAQKQHATAGSDPGLGWDRLVTGGIEIDEIPGDHYTMFISPHLNSLAHQLAACLEASRGSPRAAPQC